MAAAKNVATSKFPAGTNIFQKNYLYANRLRTYCLILQCQSKKTKNLYEFNQL